MADDIHHFIHSFSETLKKMDQDQIHLMVSRLYSLRHHRTRGRLFILGVGGSAATASHAVNDFRKICGIEAYAPTDNGAELTARTNDEGWDSAFIGWLKGSRCCQEDMLLILSVGGGSLEKKISLNLVGAMQYAKQVYAEVLGIVGRADGYAAKNADLCLVVPVDDPALVTPFAEAMHSVILHLIVSHPLLKKEETKWESLLKKRSS